MTSKWVATRNIKFSLSMLSHCVRYELFSGEVVVVRSEDVADGAQNWLASAARRVAPWLRPAVGALHELVVQSPDGRSRTFRSAFCLSNQRPSVRIRPCRHAADPTTLVSRSSP